MLPHLRHRIPVTYAITCLYLTPKIQIVNNPILVMVEIWAELAPPNHQQPWWIADIMMQSGDNIWRYDTVVDTEKEHLVRRVEEEINILRSKGTMTV